MLCMINFTLLEEILSHVVGLETSHEVWKALESILAQYSKAYCISPPSKSASNKISYDDNGNFNPLVLSIPSLSFSSNFGDESSKNTNASNDLDHPSDEIQGEMPHSNPTQSLNLSPNVPPVHQPCASITLLSPSPLRSPSPIPPPPPPVNDNQHAQLFQDLPTLVPLNLEGLSMNPLILQSLVPVILHLLLELKNSIVEIDGFLLDGDWNVLIVSQSTGGTSEVHVSHENNWVE
ncbi:hypothetical protein GIB67_028589 [Kingdonia uniflora]|uniref:Uncharacterized protein n=1 Tax=Kingdonia uniflora TaxID=39325 RepID=A0A7J7KZF6_9MAGN|nr:hypothetical protein GIB67_028589 [Kingdonia uniflora]